jgi:hypothetical protein
MLRNQKQCLPDGKEQMAGHSKGGQSLKQAVVPQKKKKKTLFNNHYRNIVIESHRSIHR